MVKGWYMPVESRRFHWFSGGGRRLRSVCGKFSVFASEVMGNTKTPEALGCPACLRKVAMSVELAAQQAGGDR